MTTFLSGFAIAITATFSSLVSATSILSRAGPPEVASKLSDNQPEYIIDVEGKRVRLVGQRFYTNPTKALDFPGRDEAFRIDQ